MFKDQTADFVSNLAALLNTTRDQRQPACEGMRLKSMELCIYDLSYLLMMHD